MATLLLPSLQNAQAYARKIEEKKEIARTMRNIFSHDSKEDALMALRSAVQYWAETKKHPKSAGWLDNNAEKSMTYFNFNEGWWRKIRASNCVERLNKEIKKNVRQLLASSRIRNRARGLSARY